MTLILYLALNIVLGIALLYCASSNRRHFLTLAGFLIPLQGLSFHLGVLISWHKIIFPIAVLGLLLGSLRKSDKTVPKLPGIRPYLILVAYITTLTLGIWGLEALHGGRSSADITGWAALQSDYRYPVQLVSYLFVWGLVLIGVSFTKDRKDFKGLAQGYVAGNVFSICVGFYQMAAKRFSLPWLDYLEYSRFLTEDAVNRSLITGSDGIFEFSRLYGLGGEPKHTAAFAILAIIVLLAQHQSAKTITRRNLFALGVLFAGILATASTGGWVALAAALVYSLVIARSQSTKRKLAYSAVVTLTLLSAISIFSFQNASDLYDSRIRSRLIDLETIGNYEPKDVAFVRYISDNPQNLILGHGAGGVDFSLRDYVPTHFLEYGGTITPAYFLTRLIGDLGLVGMALALACWLSCVRYFHSRRDSAGLNFLIGGAIVLLLCSNVILGPYLLLSASLVSYSSRKRNCSPSVAILAVKQPILHTRHPATLPLS